MGMAASQARFLGLTARKTNTEYEGQQVNQQRTALANESAGLFNQMMTLQVPVPPNSNEFYKTKYVFNDTSQMVIMDMESYDRSSGKYKLKLQYTVPLRTASPATLASGTGVSRDEASKEIVALNFGNESYSLFAVTNQDDVDAIRKLRMVPDGKDEVYHQYVINGKTYYLCKEDLEEATKGGNALIASANQYTVKDVEQQRYCYPVASFTQSETGAYDSFLIDGKYLKDNYGPDAPDPTGKNKEVYDSLLPYTHTYTALDLKQINDTKGFDDAMKKYEYDKMKYEKSIQDINAKTSVIQQQDRTLELRLKQLDTEQKALSTEMEAVQKVIQTNVEKTFKTFA